MATGGTSEATLRDLLECAICLQPMEDPRCLPCQHSFCSICLKSLEKQNPRQRVKCPSCRFKIRVKVKDLPSDFKLNTLSEFVNTCGKEEEEAVTCSFCSEDAVKREVNMFCKGCDDYLCAPCAGAHTDTLIFNNHELVQISDGKSVARPCSQHTRKRKNYYCMDCDVSTCMSCVMMKHKKHNVQDVLTYVETSKQEISNMSFFLETDPSMLVSTLINDEIDLDGVISNFDETLSEIQEQVKASVLHKIISLAYDYQRILDSLKRDQQTFWNSIPEIMHRKSTKKMVQELLTDCDNYLEKKCPLKADYEKLCSDIRDASAKCKKLTEAMSSLSSVHIPLSFSSDTSKMSVGTVKRSEKSMGELNFEQLTSIQPQRSVISADGLQLFSFCREGMSDGPGVLAADATTTHILTQLLKHAAEPNAITMYPVLGQE